MDLTRKTYPSQGVISSSKLQDTKAAQMPLDELMRGYAEIYCDRGWRIIQVWGVKKTPGGLLVCTCHKAEDCKKSPGKHPVQAKWGDIATSEKKIVRAWDWKDKNIGIVTGVKSNLFVVDIDPKDDGMTHLTEWEKEKGIKLIDDARVITGSGGYHYYYTYPEGFGLLKNKTGILKGVDIRAEGGFVVAPPSVHISGGKYEWEI